LKAKGGFITNSSSMNQTYYPLSERVDNLIEDMDGFEYANRRIDEEYDDCSCDDLEFLNDTIRKLRDTKIKLKKRGDLD